MAVRRHPVKFVPADVTVWVDEGETVIDAARRAGVVVPSPCGGRGVCGKCAVRILEGSPEPPGDVERRGLKLASSGMRLACLARVTAPLVIKPLVNLQATTAHAGDAEEGELVASVDLGTGTVAAVVIGSTSGRELGRAVVPNSQQSFGADLVSRVSAANSGHAEDLTRLAEDSALDALSLACGHAGSCLSAIRRLVVAGNSVMAASILGEPLASFGVAPYRASFEGMRALPEGSRLMNRLAPGAETLVLPPVASFVGGDVTAGIVAAGLAGAEGTALYVDIGTNAEIVCVSPGSTVYASAAAGPAVEGFGISCGGPAADGGVARVRDSGSSLDLTIVGGGEALWLTGSGLASAIASLLRLGHVTRDGAMIEEGPLASRFHRVGEVLGIDLGSETSEHPITLMQTDIRAFQTAKAAIAAGILAVARAASVRPRAIGRFVVAGGLGEALDAEDLIEIGLLPRECAGKVEQVGNASLLGAAMVAVDPSLAELASAATASGRHHALAEDPFFATTFVAALALGPYTLKRGF
ncbi:MAG: ASKHA domain-containing protein [Coriobacteriia bacterium]|nr:ASKHA domain-containing protein [Coriobacteriia bacterium]